MSYCSLNPYADQLNDGTSLNPMEVIFVKFKQHMQEAEWAMAEMTAVYSRWLEAQVRWDEVKIVHLFEDLVCSSQRLALCFGQGAPSAVNANALTPDRLSPRIGRILTMMLRGPECFDFEYYRSENWYISSEMPTDKLWSDFVHQGQFLGGKFG